MNVFAVYSMHLHAINDTGAIVYTLIIIIIALNIMALL